MTFKKIDVKDMPGNTFALYDTNWALVSAGTPDSFNTMTISWGGLGWLWRRPVAFTFVRPSRHTFNFVEEQDCYTVSFFAEGACREQLKILGSKSGRDMDKMGNSGLTPVWLDGQPAFEEAEIVLLCRKLYGHQFDYDALPQDIVDTAYPGVEADDLHKAYTSEIVACYVKG
jgi:Conserved protein/domain typically associated with flavoprotein oxygenases, DIM6/NTAB family